MSKQHGYLVYPLVDHIADKVVAIFQLYGEQRRPSTRYKDLVDLVSIATGASIAAGPPSPDGRVGFQSGRTPW